MELSPRGPRHFGRELRPKIAFSPLLFAEKVQGRASMVFRRHLDTLRPKMFNRGGAFDSSLTYKAVCSD